MGPYSSIRNSGDNSNASVLMLYLIIKWFEFLGYQDGAGGFDNTTGMFSSPAPAAGGKVFSIIFFILL